MKLTIVALLALLASACTPPLAPDGRNVDGTLHYPGQPLQPWIDTNVQSNDHTIHHTPKPGDAK